MEIHQRAHRRLGHLAVLLVMAMRASSILGEVPADYTFLVGTGSLCSSDGSAGRPAAARTDTGEVMEISGAGVFSMPNRSITAAGTYSHKNSVGELVEKGVWTAVELQNFKSYGVITAGLREGQNRIQLSRMMTLGPRLRNGPMHAGGLALIRIRLWTESGRPKEAILQVNCALGKVPENQQGDGVRVAIEESGLKFGEKVSGRAALLLRRTATDSQPKGPPGRER